jgi:hypothetical protein
MTLAAETVTAQRAALRIKTRKADPFAMYPDSPEALATWIEAATGCHIPMNPVCPGHDAPCALVADFFFNEVSEGLALARGATPTTETDCGTRMLMVSRSCRRRHRIPTSVRRYG